MKRNKQIAKILAIALAVTVMIGFTPQMAEPVCADDGDAQGTSAIVLVKDGVAPNIKGKQGSDVYFGNYQQSSDGSGGFNVEPIKWRVLSNSNGELFMLSDKSLDCVQYHEDYTYVTWAGSTIRSWLNGYGADSNIKTKDFSNGNFKDSAFSAGEYAAVKTTAVANDDNPDYDTPGGEDTNDKVFLLSLAEAQNTDYGFTGNYYDTPTRESKNTDYAKNRGAWTSTSSSYAGNGYWWLRSPGIGGRSAADVGTDGSVDRIGDDVDDEDYAVRPALNLNLESVIFTSAAVGGKDSGDVGTMSQVGTNTSGEWKLTLLDDGSTNAVGKGHKGFKVAANKVTYNSSAKTVTVPYSGAAAGDNEYISAIIKDSQDNIKYYGRIAKASSDSDASVTIDISKMAEGDTLCVFNEQYNGEKKTDYASAPVEVKIPDDDLVDTTNPITLGAGALKAGDKVYFGDQILWRVLHVGAHKDLPVCGAGKALLISDNTLADIQFNPDKDAANANVWADSNAQKWCRNYYTNWSAGIERDAILATTVAEAENYTYTYSSPHEKIGTIVYGPASLNNEYFFFLSVKEAVTLFKNDYDRKASGADNWWWLRSPTVNKPRSPGNVDDDGWVHSRNDVEYTNGARPAFNLNLSSVLFTSAISSTDNQYKLTLKDSNLGISKTDGKNVTKKDSTVTIPYTISGTNATTNTQAYVMITDKAYTDSGATVLQYSKLAPGTESGTGTFTPASGITGTWGSDYHVYLLAVNEGGEKKSDYASATPAELTTVSEHAHSFTYSASGATITAACTSGCPDGYDNTNAITLTLNKPTGDLIYNGSAWNATVSGYPETAPANLAAAPTTITYYKSKGSGSTTPDGGALSGAPSDAGNYVAQMTWGKQTVSLAFSITPATLTNVSVAQNGTLDYSGSDQIAMVTTEATAVNNQDVSFQYKATQDGDYSLEVPAFSEAGDHTVYYKADAPNHNPVMGSFIVHINKASQAAPSAPPIAASVTSTSVTLEKKDEYQYSIGGTAWQDSNVFENLEPNKEYTFYQRVAGDENHNPSPESAGTKITTTQYTLVYAPGEGTGTMDPEGVSDNDTYKFPECAFGAPQYKTFDHWKMSGADGIYYPDDTDHNTITISSNCADTDGIITVTAHWKFTNSATVTIDPIAKELTYDGSPQQLVTAGAAEGGKMNYALGGNTTTTPTEGWSESVPTGTNAGTYYVWYKAKGDSSHGDSDAKCVTAEIKKADITPTVSIAGWNYGSAQNIPAVSDNPDGSKAGNGDVTFWYKQKDAPDSAYTKDVPTDADQYTLKAEVSATDNYNAAETASVTFTISPIDMQVTSSDYNGVYDGAGHSITVNAPAGATVTYAKAGGTWTGNNPAFADKGEYEVDFKVTLKNYNEFTGSQKVIITPAAISITADDKSSQEGEALQELTYQVGGAYVAGDDLGVTLSTDANRKKAGTYAIRTSWNQNPNYEATLKDGTYIVKEKPQPKTGIKKMKPKAVKAKGKTKLVIRWCKVDGAKGYDIFFAKCGKDTKCTKIKTIKGNKKFSWTKKDLKPNKPYKAYVKAWVKKGGKKKYIAKTPTFHIYTANETKHYTNAKSITVKKAKVSLKAGKTLKIKAKINKINENKKLMPACHTKQLRYMSSNNKIATVDGSGRITAKSAGTCRIYVFAANGVNKAIKVTVVRK